jgi:hypothetical protein
MSDSAGQPPAEDMFENTAAYAWTERAHEMLQRGDLHAKAFATDGVLSAHVWGLCPRCAHELDVRETLSAAVTTTRGNRSLWGALAGALTGKTVTGDPDLPAEIPVDVECGCGHSHHGAQEKTTGCGVSFRVLAPLRPGTE